MHFWEAAPWPGVAGQDYFPLIRALLGHCFAESCPSTSSPPRGVLEMPDLLRAQGPVVLRIPTQNSPLTC